MGKRDIFNQKNVVYILDRPYYLRFDMRAIYLLEDRYETLKTAVGRLSDEDTRVVVVTAIDFLSILLNTDRAKIEKYMSADKLCDALRKIPEALAQSFPDIEDDSSEREQLTVEPWDWDFIYFIARYRLGMKDAEFWGCTPRKFYKLHDLWMAENGWVKTESKNLSTVNGFIDDVNW